MATPLKLPLKNVALNGLATQSSTHSDKREAPIAIDGVITNSIHVMTGCTHTKETLRVWFLLDLLHVYEIERVVVYNRIEDGAYRINQRTSGFTLSITKEVNGIATNEQPVEMADIKRKEFPVHNYGRFVRIHTASNEPTILSICELQVYAYTH